MGFKFSNRGFSNIIRNGKTDLRVLLKRLSESTHVPYRKLDILSLGDISPLKPKAQKPAEDAPEEAEVRVDEAGFIKPKIR